MNPKLLPLTLLFSAIVLSGCGRPVSAPTEEPASDPAAKEAPATPESAPADPEAAFSEAGDQTYLDPIALAKFTTKVMHIGDISKGHFNLYVEGGEPVAVRAWIGDEAATNVVVTKAEYEVDHHCAHLEVAQPMPEDARFWLEIETADGQRLKGSSPLK